MSAVTNLHVSPMSCFVKRAKLVEVWVSVFVVVPCVCVCVCVREAMSVRSRILEILPPMEPHVRSRRDRSRQLYRFWHGLKQNIYSFWVRWPLALQMSAIYVPPYHLSRRELCTRHHA